MSEAVDRVQTSIASDTLAPPEPPSTAPPAPQRESAPEKRPKPRKATKRNRLKWILGACVVLAGTMAGLTAAGAVTLPEAISSRLFGESVAGRGTYLTDMVRRGPFRISVRERGEVDSLKSVLLESEVEDSTTILWIIPEGSQVKEGDLLIELDSSALVEEEKQQVISLTQAQAGLTKAQQALEIQRRQNESDVAAAQLAMELAALDLKKYRDGEYEQLENEQLGLVKVAEEELALAKEVYEYSQRLAQKGYVSQNQLEADRIAMMKAEVDLKAAQENLTVLQEYTWDRQIAELTALKVEAERARQRIELQGLAALAQVQADLEAAKLTLSVEQERLDRIRTQIALCKIYAPQAGQVIYCKEDRRGDSSEVITEGKTVREQEDLINLPDLSQMKVDARIHESQISRVRKGLPVRIRVDAIHDKIFTGTVLSVSSVPVDGSWWRPNLKEYSCTVGIDYSPKEGADSILKPGLTAEVEIVVQERTDVLQVPFQAVVMAGGSRYSFVMTPQGVERRKLMIGDANDTHVEILDGVAEGEEIVLNPRTHFSDELDALDAKYRRSKGNAADKTAKPHSEPAGSEAADLKAEASLDKAVESGAKQAAVKEYSESDEQAT